MKTCNFKFEMKRGDYREFEVLVESALDSDAKIYFAVKKESLLPVVDLDDDNAHFKSEFDVDDATDYEDSAVYTIKILPADTRGKESGNFVGEIVYVDGDGHPTTYEEFPFIIKPDVNQRA